MLLVYFFFEESNETSENGTKARNAKCPFIQFNIFCYVDFVFAFDFAMSYDVNVYGALQLRKSTKKQTHSSRCVIDV